MPKKYDPDCHYCQAANNYAPSALGLPVAVFSRSQAILHEDSVYLIARSHLPNLDAMRPGERALFEEDRAQLTPGLPSAEPEPEPQAETDADSEAEYTVIDNTYAHYAERFVLPALPDDPQAFIGDLREAIGHIRERINDPLLVPNLDEKGRVVDWPHKKKEDEQIAIRIYMASKFEKGRDYTEKEVNAILNQWATFGDWALLRRELIMYGFLGRYKDGTKYWLESTTVKLI